jgi:DNA-binding NtrC family response regulator
MTSRVPRHQDHASYNSPILVACDEDAVAERLRMIFRSSNFKSERTKTIKATCRSLISGRFQVVFTAPRLSDGAWQQLFEFSRRRELGLSVVVMARTFDMHDWGDSLKCGAFDVLDILEEIPKAAEVAR